jgi:hypothetical protein
LNVGVRELAKTKKGYMPYNSVYGIMWDERTKCDKCGKIIVGGRIKLLQHKKEFHSY